MTLDDVPASGDERCFFFSSRSRHTRFKCDWSSDVCSSDLLHRLGHRHRIVGAGRLAYLAGRIPRRSGERRGGEEGRSRWAPDHLKKKTEAVEVEGAGMRVLEVFPGDLNSYFYK